MSKRSTRHTEPTTPSGGPSSLFVRLTWKATLAAIAIHAVSAFAQSYPARPIRIVVPFAAAGGSDPLARLVGPKMGEALNQTVVIENRPGAGGIIGADLVAKAPPDGYTILMTGENLAINPSLYRKLPFDATKDFARVTQLVAFPLLLVAGPKVPVASTGELIALAKSRPGALNYGHPGVGTGPHLTMELLKLSAGIDIVPIPYKGAALIQIALTTGDVDVGFTGIANGVSWVNAGRVRALAVGSARRSRAMPDVPTVAEAGVAGFNADSQTGLFVSAKTPRPVIGLIQQAAVRALNVPEVRARVEAMGYEVVGSTPEEFEAQFNAAVAKFAKIIKEARIPVLN